AARGVGLHADADQVGRLVEGNLLQAAVAKAQFYHAWCQCRERRGPKRLHLPRAQPLPLADARARTRMEEGPAGRPERHDASASSAGASQWWGAGGCPGASIE